MCDEKVRIMKPLEEMDVIDDFLFTEIMADEEDGAEVCRMILSLVLKREIGEISFTAQKAVPGISESSHGIRMDAYTTGILSMFSFWIKTHPDIPYNDGVRRIFLYVDGEIPEEAGDDDRKLKNLLRYIGKSTKDNVTDNLTDKLNDIVHRTKAKKGVGIRYMKLGKRKGNKGRRT